MRSHRVPAAAVLFCIPSAALRQVSEQARRTLTTDDDARAERALGPATGRLVSGIPGRPIWLPDGRAEYRVSTGTGWQFVLVDPRRRTRTAAFDHARLAQAVSSAVGRSVTGDSLPFFSFDLSSDGKQLTFDVTGSADGGGSARAPRRVKCDLTAYRCTAESTRRAPPPNSILSPDST